MGSSPEYRYTLDAFPVNLFDGLGWDVKRIKTSVGPVSLKLKAQLCAATLALFPSECKLAESRFTDPVHISSEVECLSIVMDRREAVLVIQLPAHRPDFIKAVIGICVAALLFFIKKDPLVWLSAAKDLAGLRLRFLKVTDDYARRIIMILAADVFHIEPTEVEEGTIMQSGITEALLRAKLVLEFPNFNESDFSREFHRLLLPEAQGGLELLGVNEKGVYFLL